MVGGANDTQDQMEESTGDNSIMQNETSESIIKDDSRIDEDSRISE